MRVVYLSGENGEGNSFAQDEGSGVQETPVGCGIWTEGKMQDEKGLELRTESLGLVCEGF